MLDLEQIFPYLNQHKLLTNSDQEALQSPFYSRNEKVTRLVTRLHRKGSNALWRFIICLRSSADGTAHDELASKLQSAVNEELTRRPLAPTSKIIPTVQSRFTYNNYYIIRFILLQDIICFTSTGRYASSLVCSSC